MRNEALEELTKLPAAATVDSLRDAAALSPSDLLDTICRISVLSDTLSSAVRCVF